LTNLSIALPLCPYLTLLTMAECHLEIKTLVQLLQARADFEKYPELASQIRSIDIEETDEEDESSNPDVEIAVNDAEANVKRNTTQAQSFCTEITFILEAMAGTRCLQSFKWTVDYYDSPIPSRPKQYWEALAKIAPTLKHLHMSFYTHEIHALTKQSLNPVPVPFDELESLTLSMDGAHGDDATVFNCMLKRIPKLRSLNLSLPSCDLEDCRIKGLAYDWTFLALENFSLSAYVNDDSGVPEFLARHPSIRTLDYDVDSDTVMLGPFTGLTNLAALNLGSWRHDSSICRIPSLRQLRIGRSLFETASALSSIDLTALRCLEIDTSYWHEEEMQNLMKETIPKLTGLLEFGVSFHSDNLTWYEDGKRFQPEPLGLDLLVCMRTSVLYIVGLYVLILITAEGLRIPSKK
jgi:hypothetical protein